MDFMERLEKSIGWLGILLGGVIIYVGFNFKSWLIVLKPQILRDLEMTPLLITGLAIFFVVLQIAVVFAGGFVAGRLASRSPAFHAVAAVLAGMLGGTAIKLDGIPVFPLILLQPSLWLSLAIGGWAGSLAGRKSMSQN